MQKPPKTRCPARGTILPMNGTTSRTTERGPVPAPAGPLTVKEAAAHLGIGERAVRKRIAAGTLYAEQIDGEWQVYPRAVPIGSAHGSAELFRGTTEHVGRVGRCGSHGADGVPACRAARRPTRGAGARAHAARDRRAPRHRAGAPTNQPGCAAQLARVPSPARRPAPRAPGLPLAPS